jgi:hypothetical protein
MLKISINILFASFEIGLGVKFTVNWLLIYFNLQSYKQHVNEKDPERIQQIIQRSLEDGEWVMKKVRMKHKNTLCHSYSIVFTFSCRFTASEHCIKLFCYLYIDNHDILILSKTDSYVFIYLIHINIKNVRFFTHKKEK